MIDDREQGISKLERNDIRQRNCSLACCKRQSLRIDRPNSVGTITLQTFTTHMFECKYNEYC